MRRRASPDELMTKRRKYRKPARPLESLRHMARRWQLRIAIRLGLTPAMADRGYMICATARTGSSYLSQLLGSTGLLGKPREYFNTDGSRRRYDRAYPSDPRAQLDIIRTTGATSNGIYGVKVVGPQLGPLEGHIDPFRDLPNLALVKLHRRDLLGQAISLARARQTGQFIASDQRRGEPAYDVQAIRYGLVSIRRQQAIWDAALAQVSIQPLPIAYEDVLADPQAVVDQIALHIGLALPVPIDRSLVTHQMQRDAQNAVWRERFLAETGEQFRHLAVT